jgi:hypothetical protein
MAQRSLKAHFRTVLTIHVLVEPLVPSILTVGDFRLEKNDPHPKGNDNTKTSKIGPSLFERKVKTK